MPLRICSLLIVLAISAACAKSPVESAGEFTSDFATALRKVKPDLKVDIEENLKLQVQGGGQTNTAFLNNAFTEYQNNPANKDAIIQRYISSVIETAYQSAHPKAIERESIVPIVKDRAWLQDIAKSIKKQVQGSKKMPELVTEDLNADLIILYASDSANNIRYLNPTDLKEAHVEKAELRKLACDNLLRILPDIKVKGSNGIYMFVAGGTYEASLLLIDSVLKSPQIQVKGERVVAVPARDMLLITGSEDPNNLATVRKAVQDTMKRGMYTLTPKLFVYRNGALEEFQGGH